MDLDQIYNKAKKTAQQPIARAYQPGGVAIPFGYNTFGADPSSFSPPSNAAYLRKSNPIYSVVTQRASYLSALPLVLYKIVQTDSSTYLSVSRSDDRRSEMIRNLLDMLKNISDGKKRTSDAQLCHFALSNATSLWERNVTMRTMGIKQITESDIHSLLVYVNPFWTQKRLIRMTSQAIDIWGQSYWFVERGDSGRGKPREIWWAKPTRVWPVTHNRKYIVGYEYQPISGGEPLFFRPEETIRIVHPDIDNEWQPLPPLENVKIHADHEQASQQANQNLHRQGLNPGAIVTPKGDTIWEEGDAREIEESINQRLSGQDRAHRWGVFRHEVNIHKSGIAPKDSQYVEGMNYDLESVARAYGWPIDLLAGKRTYENVDAAMKHAWQTITHHGSYISAEVGEALFPMFGIGSGEMLLAFDASGVPALQEPEATRWEREKGQVDRTVTRNEWRVSRGLEPKDGGDELYINDQNLPISVFKDFVEGKVTDAINKINEGGERG